MSQDHFPSINKTGALAKTTVVGYTHPNLGLTIILLDPVKAGTLFYSGNLTVLDAGNAANKMPALKRLKGQTLHISELPFCKDKDTILSLNVLTKKAYLRGCAKRFDIGDRVTFTEKGKKRALDKGQQYHAIVDGIAEYPDPSSTLEAYYTIKVLDGDGTRMLEPNGNHMIINKLDKELSAQ